MIEHGLLIAGLLLIGFLAQWAAWRVRLPAILFLLLAGIVLGPATGWFDPDRVLGESLFPSVALAVSLILFEGSLTLDFSELRDIGSAVRGMVSYGALVALVLLAATAHWVAGLDWQLAFLFGALTCVTGPTVITPMLRTLRPNARIANVLRWEGIIIDPLGALCAVLVFEAIVSHQHSRSWVVFASTVGVGIALGLAMAWALGFLLRRRWILEYLQAYATLVAVLSTFALSNVLAHESGLLAVTIMGIVLGNMRQLHITQIAHFKEHLSTLLVSMLFIVLAARLPWPMPPGMLGAGIAVFLIAQWVIRPVSVFAATLGSQLTWRERALLGYVSPRGVVAASVTALFALRLEQHGIAGANSLVPLVFILIIGTVLLQSATARLLALALGVAAPPPRGVLIFGSDPVARCVAAALHARAVPVMLADDDWAGISAARMAGLPTFYGNPTSQYATQNLDLVGFGRLFAMSTRRELNSLACLQYREEFGRQQVFRLRVLDPDGIGARTAFADELQSKSLFGAGMTHARFAELLLAGWRMHANDLTEVFGWDEFRAQHGAESILLIALDPNGHIHVTEDDAALAPRPHWCVIALVPPGA